VQTDAALAERIEAIGVRAFVAEWERLPLFASQRTLAPEILAAQRATRLARGAHGLSRSLRTVGLGCMPDLGPALRGSPAVLSLITGALDEKFTRLAAELRPLRHTIVPGVGHNVLLEKPEAVAQVIRSAVDRVAVSGFAGARP